MFHIYGQAILLRRLAARPGEKGMPPRDEEAEIALYHKWPTCDKEKRATMILDTGCKVENDPYGEERKAWESIGYGK
jgi:hypothetical protein